MDRHRHVRPDGRYLLLYARDGDMPSSLSEIPELARDADRIELRRNPLCDEWVIISTGRQERTFLPPTEYCPLCPTRPSAAVATEIPAADFEIAVFENRFPGFRPDAPEVSDDSAEMRRARAAGFCEVVVYSADHDATLASLTDAHARALIDVWADRYDELCARPEVAYVFVFENRGAEIGVTLTHPHGQIYAFPFIPPHVAREHAAASVHHERSGRCIVCDAVRQERDDGRRVVAEADGFLAYVPFAARVPYEVHVAPVAHRASLLDLDDGERSALARIVSLLQRTYDALWQRPMPYTMSMHQRASDGVDRPGDHLHIEFLPPYRSRDRLKHLAGVETGAGTFINDTAPEEKAAELRAALQT
jgi:UDPglucose--hexose-1-phosphate uridylyltransferase